STVQWALGTGQHVSMWGPYQIKQELYCRALEQCKALKSGKMQYKVLDAGHFSSRVCNCIHGVSSILGGSRLHVMSPNFGDLASFYVLQRMRPWIIDCSHTEDWIVPALGLDCYPIIHRGWERPHRHHGCPTAVIGANQYKLDTQPEPDICIE